MTIPLPLPPSPMSLMRVHRTDMVALGLRSSPVEWCHALILPYTLPSHSIWKNHPHAQLARDPTPSHWKDLPPSWTFLNQLHLTRLGVTV
ncbi:hypothetical protein ACHWQZ_G008546 [Mnemiopsis leidyi]